MVSTQLIPTLAAVSIDLDITVALQFVNFAVAVAAVYFIIGGKYLKVREERREATSGSREDADEMLERTEQLKEEFDDKMASARRDATEVRESLRGQGVAEQEDIIGEVRVELSEKLEAERAKIQAKVDEAEAELDGRAKELAELMVAKVIPGKAA
jgi:F-type H+-transporting ATPase subunit b